jgi:hypothetical protein
MPAKEVKFGDSARHRMVEGVNKFVLCMTA